MSEEVAVLDPQEDASVSLEDRYANDMSVNTAEVETVEVDAETEDTEVDPENEADSSPADEESVEETIDSQQDDTEYSAAVQERIDKLTELRRVSERLSDSQALRIAELEAQVAAAPRVDEAFKTLADFDYDDSKYHAYMGAEIDRRATAAAERVARNLESQAGAEGVNERFAERERVFAKTVKDYDAVAKVNDGSLKITPYMADVIKAQDNGPEFAYYLGKHTDIAKEISLLSPQLAGFEMGKIHARLVTEKAKAATKSVTKTPPPVPKIKSGNEGMSKNPADMTDREFAKWRGKQIANR